jgi:hypothetical protein
VSRCQIKQLSSASFSSGLRYDLTLAFHNSSNASFIRHSPPASFTDPTPSADVGFIHLHRRTLQLQIPVGHQRTNLLEHAPRGFVGHRSFALDLFCGDSATGGTHLVHRMKPLLQRSARFLEDGPSQRVEMPATPITRKRRAPANAMVFCFLFAFLATRDSARPALLEDVHEACIIRGELTHEALEAVAKLRRDRLLNCDVFSSGHDLACPIPYLLSRDNYHVC